METTTINVDKYYLNRKLYTAIPADVFDALEAAFLANKTTVEIATASYEKMMLEIKKQGLCLE